MLGTVAHTSARDVTGDRAVQRAMAHLGAHASPVTAYLGLTFLILSFMIALIAAGQAAALRDEEASGRAGNLFAAPVRRGTWLAGRLALAAALLIITGLVMGAGAWAGAVSQHGQAGLGSLLAAGLNAVPPGLLLLGLGAAVTRRIVLAVVGLTTVLLAVLAVLLGLLTAAQDRADFQDLNVIPAGQEPYHPGIPANLNRF